MKIYPGQHATNQKEARDLAFQSAGVEGMSADVPGMFESMVETDKTNSDADKTIGTAVRSRTGSKATWHADRWFVPVPTLQYQGKDVPHLIIEVNTYLVAAAVVRTPQDSRLMTMVESMGKPITISIPLLFLHVLLKRDLGRFAIIARDALYTTWEVPGAKPVHLPHDFINKLSNLLEWQSVVTWLEKFGSQGRYMAPLVAGNLLGLAFQDSTQPVPVNSEIVTPDGLVSALESMAFRHSEAEDMVKLAAPRLRADMTLEEAIRITLQTGKGGVSP